MKLLRGNCEKLLKTIPSNSVDLVVTDPPYDLDTGNGTIMSKTPRAYETEIRGMSHGFSPKVLDELLRVMKRVNIYIFCSRKQLPWLLNYFKGYHWDLLKWIKSNPIPACNNRYLSDCEYCLFFRGKNVRIRGNYHTKKTCYISGTNQTEKKKYHHPTVKPLPFVSNMVTNSSKPGDTVLDCFMGSGTTGVAAQQLKRDFIGIEKDPEYFKTAKQRIDQVKGELV